MRFKQWLTMKGIIEHYSIRKNTMSRTDLDGFYIVF